MFIMFEKINSINVHASEFFDILQSVPTHSKWYDGC
jgi:hypothetical protein